MIGGGMLLDKIEKLIEDLQPKNLKLIKDFLPKEKLVKIMQGSHISLGQLSNHDRLKRTIPHKCYETLALGLPYLTAVNEGVMELLVPGETCIACNPADERSLAEKILWAKDHPQELKIIAEKGYRLYQTKLKSDILARNLLDKISKI